MSNITLEKINNFLKVREHEIILFFLCSLALAYSFLNPFWFHLAGSNESSIFATIGKMWANGSIPYSEMIYTSGPGIFFVNMVGYGIGGYTGIAFLQTVLLIFGVISVDLTLRLFKFSPLARFSSIVIVISIHALKYYYGNMIENYALYFAMLSSYPFAWFYYYRRFSWIIATIPMLLFAFSLTMRVTSGAYFIAWYAILFCYFYANGLRRSSLKLLLSVLLGFVIVFGGFALYFYSKDPHILQNVIFYGLFLGNGESYSVVNLLYGLLGFFRTGLWIVLIGFYILLKKYSTSFTIHDSKKDRFWVILYVSLGFIISCICNSFSASLSEQFDAQYLPFMFIPLAFMMHRFLHVIKDVKISFFTIAFLIAFLLSHYLLWGTLNQELTFGQICLQIVCDSLCALLVCTLIYILFKKVILYRHSHTFILCTNIIIVTTLIIMVPFVAQNIGKPTEQEQLIIDVIVENTEPDKKIWVDVDRPQFYVWTDRLPAASVLFSADINPGYDVKQKNLTGLHFYEPLFIITSSDELAKFNLSTEKAREYRSSKREFYSFLNNFYAEATKNLFVKKVLSEKLKYNPMVVDLSEEVKILDNEQSEENIENNEKTNNLHSDDASKNNDTSDGLAVIESINPGNPSNQTTKEVEVVKDTEGETKINSNIDSSSNATTNSSIITNSTSNINSNTNIILESNNQVELKPEENSITKDLPNSINNDIKQDSVNASEDTTTKDTENIKADTSKPESLQSSVNALEVLENVQKQTDTNNLVVEDSTNSITTVENLNPVLEPKDVQEPSTEVFEIDLKKVEQKREDSKN